MPSVLKLIFMYNICKQANDLSVIKDALAFKLHICQKKQGPKLGT